MAQKIETPEKTEQSVIPVIPKKLTEDGISAIGLRSNGTISSEPIVSMPNPEGLEIFAKRLQKIGAPFPPADLALALADKAGVIKVRMEPNYLGPEAQWPELKGIPIATFRAFAGDTQITLSGRPFFKSIFRHFSEENKSNTPYDIYLNTIREGDVVTLCLDIEKSLNGVKRPVVPGNAAAESAQACAQLSAYDESGSFQKAYRCWEKLIGEQAYEVMEKNGGSSALDSWWEENRGSLLQPYLDTLKPNEKGYIKIETCSLPEPKPGPKGPSR